MLSYVQAVILGLVQGITELFPISSLGHSVLIPHLLGWNIDLSQPPFLAFVVLTHLATALVLLGFFWSDWLKIIGGILRSLAMREIADEDTYAKLGWLLIIGTIPAGIVGLLFQQQVQQLFSVPSLVAAALVCNGIVLFAAEKLRKRIGRAGTQEGAADDTKIAKLSWMQSIGIGFAQCGALIPGFSRTGLTMTGSLWSGLSHENAARYSFLLATPIIFAAAILKVPDLFGADSAILGPSLLGALCAAIAAYVSVKFLTQYFQTKTLRPFALYCITAGLLSLLLLH